MDALAMDPSPRRLGKTDLVAGPLAYGLWRFAGTEVAAARATATRVRLSRGDGYDVVEASRGTPRP